MNPKPLYYQTDLPAAQCIAAEPWEYGDELTPLWYRCDAVAETGLVVTFRGGKFRKIVRTRYRMAFSPAEGRTVIRLDFLDELLGLPPMTLITDIDLFLSHKLRATRIMDERR